MTAISPNLWTSTDHALEYLARADQIPHRTEGERALLEWLPPRVHRFLDLGSGDGRLAALVRTAHPAAELVALDFSSLMLQRLRERFAADPSVTVLEHDLGDPLPSVGRFDVVVSSFAIHHVSHDRKRALYAEIWNLLGPGGVFCNREHVASPTLHYTRASWLNSASDPRMKTFPINCSTSKPNWPGCGSSASKTSIAPGSGWSWHYSWDEPRTPNQEPRTTNRTLNTNREP